jgi:hypothetical protein
MSPLYAIVARRTEECSDGDYGDGFLKKREKRASGGTNRNAIENRRTKRRNQHTTYHKYTINQP